MNIPSVFDFLDYKEYLHKMVSASPRGFKKKMAEDSGCQTAYISHVLNGTAHLSWEQAEAISTGLGHNNEEKEYFLFILKYSTAGTLALKKFIRGQLDRIRNDHLSIKERIEVEETLSRENQARYYSAWYYAAIHVMLTIPKFQVKENLAHYLRLKPKTVNDVLEFLVSVGLAAKNGAKFQVGTVRIHLEKDSPLIYSHHTNWRMLAIRSLENALEEDLHFSAVFTLSEQDIYEIRRLLLKSIQKLISLAKESKEEGTLALACDFFQV